MFKATGSTSKSPGSTAEARGCANQGQAIARQGGCWRASLPPAAPASCYITEPEGENHISNVTFLKDNVKTAQTKPLGARFRWGRAHPRVGPILTQ